MEIYTFYYKHFIVSAVYISVCDPFSVDFFLHDMKLGVQINSFVYGYPLISPAFFEEFSHSSTEWSWHPHWKPTIYRHVDLFLIWNPETLAYMTAILPAPHFLELL